MIRKGNFNVEVEQVHFLSLSQALAWLVEPEKIRAFDNNPRALKTRTFKLDPTLRFFKLSLLSLKPRAFLLKA